jgi:hypothetical protein
MKRDASPRKMDKRLRRLLDTVEKKYAGSRRTFTEEEAFADIWEAGYDASPQSDPRFALAHEADGKNLRHWCLASQVVANNRLVEALETATWDGRDLDAELARMGEDGGGHFVFCAADPRFAVCADGRLDLADREDDVPLPDEERSELDALLPSLREHWLAEDGTPRTVRQMTESLGALGWSGATVRGGWLRVRAWLKGCADIVRVGRDFWILADKMPCGPTRLRLSVLPISHPATTGPTSLPSGQEPAAGSEPSSTIKTATEIKTTVPMTGLGGSMATSWTVVLRTVNLVEGFLPVPSTARSGYPPRASDSAPWEAIPGKWFSSGDSLWLWLDRDRDLLCGSDLADRLAWCEAGEVLAVEWSADVVVLRQHGVDEQVRQEESRLVDRDALAALRGGVGESYRQSLMTILTGAPNGMTFREVVEALRARQQHVVHQGTVRTLLCAGAFVCREGRWFTAPDSVAAARQLRKAIVLVGKGETDVADPAHEPQNRTARTIASYVTGRLRELIDLLKE